MPAGMDGANAVTQAQEEQRQRSNRIFNLIVGNGEVAVIRSLANGSAQDRHFGMAEVLEHVWTEQGQRQYEWEPAPGAFDDQEGKYRGSLPAKGLGSWKTGMKAGLFVWCYFLLRTEQHDDDWQQVVLSESWLEEMYGIGRAGNDPYGGVRYLQPSNRVLLWLRGPGFGQEFVNGFYAGLTKESRDRNLTSHPIAVARWDQKPRGRSNIVRPQWTYAIVDPEWNRRAADWPELHVQLDKEVEEEQKRYYAALPHIREVFEGTMKWPLFDEEGDSEPVPERGAAAERRHPDDEPEPPRPDYPEREERNDIEPMEQEPVDSPQGLSDYLD